MQNGQLMCDADAAQFFCSETNVVLVRIPEVKATDFNGFTKYYNSVT